MFLCSQRFSGTKNLGYALRCSMPMNSDYLSDLYNILGLVVLPILLQKIVVTLPHDSLGYNQNKRYPAKDILVEGK